MSLRIAGAFPAADTASGSASAAFTRSSFARASAADVAFASGTAGTGGLSAPLVVAFGAAAVTRVDVSGGVTRSARWTDGAKWAESLGAVTPGGVEVVVSLLFNRCHRSPPPA